VHRLKHHLVAEMKEAKRNPTGIIYVDANKSTRPFNPRKITLKDLVNMSRIINYAKMKEIVEAINKFDYDD
jgi:hypothetical protein